MAETAIDTTVAVTDRSAMLTRSDTAQQSAVSLALSSEVKVTTGAEVELLSSIKVANATEIAPASTQTNLAPHAESPTAKPDAKVALSEPSSIAPAEVLVNGQRPQTQPESTPFGNVSKFPAQFASSSVANSSHRLAAAVATPPSAILPLSAQWVSTMGDMVARAQQRQPGKNSVQPDYSVAGIWGQSALASDLQFNALPASTGTLTPNLAAGIADTVAYWAAQGVQNAELKLDGFGEHPVQVHIALNGDQAQIGFRTDQPEIRAILEGANGPLKELLRSEGLTLTGVSVGSSGERSAAQDQGAAGGHRQRSLISPVPTVTVHSVRGVQPTPAGVDIFV